MHKRQIYDLDLYFTDDADGTAANTFVGWLMSSNSDNLLDATVQHRSGGKKGALPFASWVLVVIILAGLLAVAIFIAIVVLAVLVKRRSKVRCVCVCWANSRPPVQECLAL